VLVKLLVNIGTQDALFLGVSQREEGSVIEVKDHAAQLMINRGWAEESRTSKAAEIAVEEIEGDEETIVQGIPDEDIQGVPPTKKRGRPRRNA